jgi:hypothetical protein
MNPMKIRTLTAVVSIATLALAVSAQAQRGQKKAGHAVRGKVTSISESGFVLQGGGKKASTPTVTQVTVNGETKVFTVNRGGLGDLKADDWVAVVGEPGADGKLAASGVVRLAATGGAPDQRLATAIVAGARPMFGGGKKAALAAPRAPAAPAPGAPGTPAAPPATAARRQAARPTLGKVVSTSPLKIDRAGQTVEVTLAATSPVAVVAPITVKDLRPGDTVSVLGQAAPAATVGQPSATTAQVVIRAAGKVKAKKKKKLGGQ